ncbi:MAG: ATP-binding cassette domain-containing protein [Desulfurococcales archaeon]|nr:ATP-binding cassette domain-containing protein [Desulfurococcales archaeon]
MVEVQLRSVRNFILKSITDTFPSGKLTVVLGPNGAGKTTLLRVIAGVERYEGSVLFDGRPVDDVPPYERNVSYVPQRSSLFKNMSVFDNVAYGLRVRGCGRDEVREKVYSLLKAFKLEHLAGKYPHTLSGGEAKRVALARALAVEPQLLLLDEPLSGLDAEVAELFKQELMMAIRSFRRTAVLVTHSVRTAVQRAAHLLLLWGGEALYRGPPEGIGRAELPDEVHFWLGSVVRVGSVRSGVGYMEASIDSVTIPLLSSEGVEGVKYIVIPPDALKVCREGDVEAKVVKVVRSGTYYRAVVDISGVVKLYLTTPAPVREGEVTRLRIQYGVPLRSR